MTSKKKRILVVDDSENMLEIIDRNLKKKGFLIYSVTNVVDAITILQSTHIHLVITDLQMPNVNGVELLKYVKENLKYTEVLVITGHPSIKTAIETVKIGADEYLIKSFTDEELFDAVNKALNKQRDRDLCNSNETTVDIKGGIIGGSEAMQKVYKSISKASKLKATVLLTGETGTGKELVARAIHYNSKELNSPFIAVNCGGIPESLLESELFGYVKGAFTGANETRGGFFQAADGGTIFLDEISNTTLSMQAKLLRVIQEKEVNMIGSSKTQKIDLRIIAATNVDLLKLSKKGTFREDLYYRLNVLPIDIPPLRERGDDILLLMNYFIQKYSLEAEKQQPIFTDDAINVLRRYYWPGNVRELENIIQRLVIMSDEKTIEAPDLPEFMRFETITKQLNLTKSLAEVQNEHIQNVLISVGGNKSRAAEILKIDRKTILEKVKNSEDK